MIRSLNKALIFISLISFFVFGVIVGYYKFFPFDDLSSIKSLLTTPQSNVPQSSKLTFSQELQQYAFTRKAPNSGLIYDAISKIEDLYKFNRAIFIPRDDFKQAYENIIIGNVKEIFLDSTPILEISFILKGKPFKAYAYGNAINECNGSSSSAALIIPGSGNNQSLGIYQGDSGNYHYGILDALNKIQKIIVQIKPNQDARAWHNDSGMKVNEDFIFNWQLKMGGSYSVSYLIEAMALMKYLKQCSEHTVIAGLSQGGLAALHIALQASPTQAIISSGYSVLEEQIEWADFNQLMGVPGSEIIATNQGLISSLKKSSTKYLFTWGKKENFYFREEAINLHTAKILKQLQNAYGISHDGGHIFPVSEIKEFISSNLKK